MSDIFQVVYTFYRALCHDFKSFSGYLSKYYFAHNLILGVFIYFMAIRHFRTVYEIRKRLGDFDVRNCKLSTEDDREPILAFINQLFQKDAHDARISSALESNTSVEPISPRSQDIAGILAFNDCVKTLVPKQLPGKGVKSWKIFTFMPAVLISGMLNTFANYDYEAYGTVKGEYSNFWKGVKGVWSWYIWYPFILCSLDAFLQG